jgi:hypothetical protein
MPIYVTVAYAIFCMVPLGLGLAIALRQRRLTRALHDLDPQMKRAEDGEVRD